MQIKSRVSASQFLKSLRDSDSATGKLLCKYVDEWLDTALDGDVEEPLKRSLGRTPSALRVLHRYISEYPVTMVLASDGYYGWFGIGHLNEVDPAKHAGNQAAYLFAVLIDSDWRQRLYKCRRCGQYGVLSRKPAPIYKNGIHCPKCRNAATAVRSRGKMLKKLHGQRLELAAHAWREWKPTTKYGDRKIWVLQRVNERIGNSDRIKINWVTRNLDAIKKEAEERHGTR